MLRPRQQRERPVAHRHERLRQPPLPRAGHIAVIRYPHGHEAQRRGAREQLPRGLRAREGQPLLHPVTQQHLPARKIAAGAAQALRAERALQLAQTVGTQKRAAPVRLRKVGVAVRVHAHHAPELLRQRMPQAQIGILRIGVNNDLPRGAARLRTRTGDAPERIIVVGSGLVHGGLLTLIDLL